MKLLLSYLLVGAFVFLSAPKELFHTHDHDHHEEDHGLAQDHEDQFEEDCFVCDFDYSTFSASIQVPLSFQQDSFYEKIVSVKSGKSDRFILSASGRGPPLA